MLLGQVVMCTRARVCSDGRVAVYVCMCVCVCVVAGDDPLSDVEHGELPGFPHIPCGSGCLGDELDW
jgi:hypothetical protein